MDKKEKNKITRKRILLPSLVWACIFVPYLFLKLPGRENVFIGSFEILGIFVVVYGFIRGNLLRKTTPQYIIHRIVVCFIIINVLVTASIILLIYL